MKLIWIIDLNIKTKTKGLLKEKKIKYIMDWQ